jgi:hypothetical protein
MTKPGKAADGIARPEFDYHGNALPGSGSICAALRDARDLGARNCLAGAGIALAARQSQRLRSPSPSG